jgi:murein DD-endopeptidase MepM/ murein hydrolase activator NlpD
VARFPVDIVSIASGYKDPRRNPTHYGLDLAGKLGTPVLAPEAGKVLIAHESDDPDRADNTTLPAAAGDPWAPFQGYGPGVVVLAGVSGRFHLLAHLFTVGVAAGDTVDEGARLGSIGRHVGASGGHTHWEVRTVPVDNGPATREKFTVDPSVWVRDTAAPAGSSRRDFELVAVAVLLWLVIRRR